MYGDVSLFLFITADRTLVASRLHNYLKTIEHGGVAARAGGRERRGELDQYLGMSEPQGRVGNPDPV